MYRLRTARAEITTATRGRHGAIVPIVAVSLLVILLAIALVLDRSYLDIGQVELRRAAEAGALAGAHSLANDDLLRSNADPRQYAGKVRHAVKQIVAENFVAGEQVKVVPKQDIQLGKITVDGDGGPNTFLETDKNPTTVRVTLNLTDNRDNPVGLFMSQLTGQPSAELAQQVAASADNRCLGVRPYEGANVPGIPFAILADDPTQKRTDTWLQQIVRRLGADKFGYDEKLRRITNGPDGIPEIVLTGEDPQDKNSLPNVAMVDLGTGLRATGLVRQIRHGFTEANLKGIGGEIRLPEQPVTLSSTARLTIDPLRALAALQGECRICLLYQESTKEGYSTPGTVTCVGLVAGRVMQVIPSPNKASKIVFQPGVIVTRTAILPELQFSASHRKPPRKEWLNPYENKYIYKTSLTQ